MFESIATYPIFLDGRCFNTMRLFVLICFHRSSPPFSLETKRFASVEVSLGVMPA